MRVALIHAMAPSIPPVMAAFARLWPEAGLMNLLDDSLSTDLARDGRLTQAMTERFLALARYAVSTGPMLCYSPARRLDRASRRVRGR
jgi:hypothetical protein